jgi:hypothetical protein
VSGHHLWPTSEQKLLLQAALAGDGAGMAAIDAWHSRTDFGGAIDSGSFRLLPLAHANLEALGCEHPAMQMLGGVRRRAWVETQLRDRFATEVLREFAAGGIPTIVAKGLALAHGFYPDPALRPMSDVDLLVPPSRADAAISALQALGFELLAGCEAGPILSHAVHLIRDGREQIDLHIALFSDIGPAEAQDRVWDAAVPVKIRGVEALRPGDSDMLLHVMVHGVRANPVPPLRWVTDAAMIMRNGGPLDWDRIVDGAIALKVSVRLRMALDFLIDEMDFQVPAAPIERLRTVRPALFERMENAAILSLWKRPGWAARWGSRAAMTGRLVSSGQIRRLRGLVAGSFRRRLAAARRRA